MMLVKGKRETLPKPPLPPLQQAPGHRVTLPSLCCSLPKSSCATTPVGAQLQHDPHPHPTPLPTSSSLTAPTPAHAPQNPPGRCSPPASPSLCRCAKLLLRHGAIVNLPSEDGEETALHVAAKHCLCDHARLYLRHGARVDARSAQEDTALGVLCGQAPGAGEGCLQLCRLLAAHGADIDARDEMRRSPLHKACGAANAGLARFLLRCGADVNAIDYDGVSPLGCVLQNAAFKKELRPHLTVQLLLNHGSQKIWPPAFVKVPTPKPLPYIPWHPGFCNWGRGALGNKKPGRGGENLEELPDPGRERGPWHRGWRCCWE